MEEGGADLASLAAVAVEDVETLYLDRESRVDAAGAAHLRAPKHLRDLSIPAGLASPRSNDDAKASSHARI